MYHEVNCINSGNANFEWKWNVSVEVYEELHGTSGKKCY